MEADNIKAVIFDMGGVFIQTKDKGPRNRLAERLGMTYEDLSNLVFQSPSAQKATVGLIDEQDHWKFLADYLNLKPREMETFWGDFWGGDFLDNDLYKFAITLKENYALGLLSNAWSGARDLLTRRYNFLDIFDTSIFSAEIKMAKPDPAFYQWILEKMKVKAEQAIFVDDFIENITAAKEIGLRTVHFKNTSDAIDAINSFL
ncbi:MAG TPA: HAD family phosphatase [Anaerolineaceae bacterium]|nr:HAD family phosphatase [Anaerolineaceae bacterium]